MRNRPTATPKVSATIRCATVSCPAPWSATPVTIVTAPSALTRKVTELGPPPVWRQVSATPRP